MRTFTNVVRHLTYFDKETPVLQLLYISLVDIFVANIFEVGMIVFFLTLYVC